MTSELRILVVEDDEDDFFFTERVLRKFSLASVRQLESGRAAIEYLAGTGPFADRAAFPLPDVVFLDLKMERDSGHEVLAWVRQNLPPPRPRIYVLTGSNEPRDRDLVQRSGAAAGYIVKPLSVDHLRPIFGRSP